VLSNDWVDVVDEIDLGLICVRMKGSSMLFPDVSYGHVGKMLEFRLVKSPVAFKIVGTVD
jgi:hypothetical protein